MTQNELDRQISKQTGEPITEIARRGFIILKELPDEMDNEPQQPKAPAATD